MPLLRKTCLVMAALVIAVLPATHAHSAEYTYAPQDCDFTLTLPSTPITVKRCHPAVPDRCDLRTAYTHVYDMTATLNVYVKCDPVEEGAFERFSEDAVQTSLIALTGGKLDTYQTAAEKNGDLYTGMIMGATSGPNNNPALYVAQIRTTPQSRLVIEAEIVGPAHEDADGTLIDILQSIELKNAAQNTDENSETPAETTAE